MKIKEHQINELESLIIEGEVTMCSSSKGKNNYIDKVKGAVTKFCHENGEQEPNWVHLSLPTISVGNEEQTNQDAQAYYEYLLPFFINMLREIRTGYYLRRQLDESHNQTLEACKQTVEAEKQTTEAIKANKKTTNALWISGIAVVISVIALGISTCTRTIKFDEKQYKELKSTITCDSIDTVLKSSNANNFK